MMTKQAQFSTGVKVFYLLHLVLTFLATSGVIYLFLSLNETQTELQQLKHRPRCICNIPTVKVERKQGQNNENKWNYTRYFYRGRDIISERFHNFTGYDPREKIQKRKRRELYSEAEKNQTCAEMIRDFMKLLHLAKKLIPNNTNDTTIFPKTVVCLPGPAGRQGQQGPKGACGEMGYNGTKGDRGVPGGPGPKGARGEMGYNGTKGDKGARGDIGYNGTHGNRGAPGPKGCRGEVGYNGSTGEKGARGDMGYNGTKGAKGDMGEVKKLPEAPPEIVTHPPKTIFVSRGDNLTLNCTGIGHPTPSVTWTKENDSLPVARLFPKHGKGAQLEFTKITYEKKGKYTCVATSSVGRASFDVGIIFKAAPRRLRSEEIIAYKGNLASIKCPLDSYPPARIRWINTGYSPLPQEVFEVNNTLNIKRINERHAGIYLCEGTNMFGSTFTAVAVKVRKEVAPSFKEHLPSSHGVFRHQRVTINCDATGDPMPSVTWKKRGQRQSGTQKSSAQLVIDSFEASNEGNYTCKAENALGQKVVANIRLYLIHCPRLDPPVNGQMTSLIDGSDNARAFSCDKGSKMIGPEIRICGRSATWSGEPTYCIGNILNKEGSQILAGHKEYRDILLNFLKPVQESSSTKWKLCYRASTDGWSAFAFHGACGDRESTVTIIKVGLFIFGGYSDKKFEVPVQETRYRYGYRTSSRMCHRSSNSFVFSLKNNGNIQPFKSKPYQQFNNAICADASKGVVFSNDISISDFASSNNGSSTSLGYTYRPPEGYTYGEFKTKTLLAGKEYFTPDEIEVYFDNEVA